MTNALASTPFMPRDASWAATVEDLDIMRGRTRDRSLSRADGGKPRPDDASNLRGRSRRRAASPVVQVSRSRNASPSFSSHLLQYRLKDLPRRDHCPSRPASRQSSPRRRVQRTRSRSRNDARLAHALAMESQRLLETQHSGLRNELMMMEEGDETVAGHPSSTTNASAAQLPQQT